MLSLVITLKLKDPDGEDEKMDMDDVYLRQFYNDVNSDTVKRCFDKLVVILKCCYYNNYLILLSLGEPITHKSQDRNLAPNLKNILVGT